MTTTNNIIAGVDLGGTTTKAALFSCSGEMIHSIQIPTPVSSGPEAMIRAAADAIKQLLAESEYRSSQLAGVGVGVPGRVDIHRGIAVYSINLGFRNTPVKSALEQLLGVPVAIENDANVAALGERWQGAGKNTSNMIMVTLGTGVGGAIIANGQIVHGAVGSAGEVGHIVVEPANGLACNCGNTGCLESYASATAIIRAGEEAARNGHSPRLAAHIKEQRSLTAKDVIDAAKAGDHGAASVIQQAAYYLGLGLGQAASLLNPEKIVIGGGVSAAGEYLLAPVRESFQRYCYHHAAHCELLCAQLGNDAGMIGAAWLITASHPA